MSKGDVDPNIAAGLVHLRFACSLYISQINRGKSAFLHEHPQSARSWDTKMIKKIMSLPGVGTCVSHQCMFGLETVTDTKESMPAKKPTMWMCNSPLMLHELSVRCDNSHSHQHLTENRAKACEDYPLERIRAIIRGMQRTADANDAVRSMNTEAWNLTMSLRTHDPGVKISDEDAAAVPASTLKTDDGSDIPISFDANNF